MKFSPRSLVKSRRALVRAAALAAAILGGSAAHADLLLYYNFEGVAGTNVPNLGTLGAPGVLTNGTTAGSTFSIVGGAPGGSTPGSAVRFAMVGDLNSTAAAHIVTNLGSTALGLHLGTNFTASAWFNTASLTTDSMIFGQLAGNRLHLGLRTNKPHLGLFGQDTIGQEVVNTNEWYHVAFVVNNGIQQIYLNGQADGGPAWKGPLNNTNNVVIGTANGGTGGFSGMLDDVAIYNQPLSQNQVAFLATGGSPTALPAATPDTPPILHTWVQTPNGKWNRVELREDFVTSVPLNQNNLTYVAAKANAATLNYNGAPGHLATPRTRMENDRMAGLILNQTAGNAWIGLDDTAVEGEWRLADGANEHIWQGLGSGAGGVPVGGAFTRWNGTVEPNNSGDEDAAEMLNNGLWNDLPANNVAQRRSSLVEYETQLNDRPDLPGPAGGPGYFGVRMYTNYAVANTNVSIYGIEAALYSGRPRFHSDTQQPVINFVDPQAAGSSLIGGDSPFPSDTPAADDNFILVAHGRIRIPSAGAFTFGFKGDDGDLLRVKGATFASSTTVAGNALQPAHFGDTLVHPNHTGDSLTFGVINFPAPGDYDIEFLFNEAGGGASAELFAAPGAHTAFNANFRLIGDTAIVPVWSNVKPGLINGWDTVTLREGAADINAAVAQVTDFLLNPGNHPNAIVSNHQVINFNDPEGPGNPQGFAGDVDFDGGAGFDDNNLALGARAQILIEVPGVYTFNVAGDDGYLLSIPGATVVAMPGPLVPTQSGADTVITNGCCNHSLVQFNFPTDGVYDINLVFNEIAGGGNVEVSIAFGAHTAFNPEFWLLGQAAIGEFEPILTLTQGLALVPLPGAAWAGLALMGGMAFARRNRNKA